ncbi:MAG: thiamine-phosphate kinase [Acetobacter sp.]|nr:thiamine-phosphate kinase [Acetobacter sp.]
MRGVHRGILKRLFWNLAFLKLLLWRRKFFLKQKQKRDKRDKNVSHHVTHCSKEFSFIQHYFSSLAGEAALGLRDDAAIFTPPEGQELVVTADGMVENVHFFSDDPPETIGRKLLRCNLSDLAAMGSKPEGWLLTFARPPHITEAWVQRFTEGIARDQEKFQISLMGGDTLSTSGPLVLSLTLIGSVPRGQAIQRKGARAGDGIWVTGTIGDAALGLKVLRGELEETSGWLIDRYRMPCPRVGLPLFGLASAALDISDGLVQDCGHLAHENGLHAVLEADRIPLSLPAKQAGAQWFKTCLTGGDDYEILMVVPPQKEKVLEKSGFLQTPYGTVPVTRIGVFVEGAPAVTVYNTQGTPMVFTTTGWSHI